MTTRAKIHLAYTWLLTAGLDLTEAERDVYWMVVVGVFVVTLWVKWMVIG